jgi:Carboxypeptidase regulatory-like domain
MLVLAIVVVARLAAAQPQPQPNQAQQPPVLGTAAIKGHVYDGDGGRPLRRVQVMATGRTNSAATTDDQGVYEIHDLPAGKYAVFASKPNYVRLAYGQRSPLDQPRLIDLIDGQTIEKIDVTLTRGSVITGHVVDEFGDPVPNAQVTLVRGRNARGRRIFEQAGRMATTDDLGEYRLFGLNPGNYYVSASLRVPAGPPTDPDVPGYAVTLAPGTTSASEAQKVSVAEGQTVEEVNVALIPAKLARISGSASKSNGEPMSGGFVNVTPRDHSFVNGYGGQLRPDGTFVVQSVPPGDYNLTAQAPPAPGATRPEVASATVSVAGGDVNGVQLVVVPPVTASGTVILDPAAASTVKPSSIRISINALDPQQNMSVSTNMAVKDDFTFELSVMPGASSLNLVGSPTGVALKAVRVGGVDVTDSGFDVKAGENIRGIEIELTSQPTTVSGVVNDAGGNPAAASRVLIFPRDDRKWDGLSRYTRFSSTDADGKFKVSGLPPGDYYAVAGSDVTPDAAGDPDALEKLRTRAQSFSLNEGETKVLDLKM